MNKIKFNKSRKIILFSSISLLTASITPFVASCSNAFSNNVHDSNIQNNNNIIGTIPQELKIFEEEILNVNKYEVKSEIEFKDYEKPSYKDGNYLYIHERGNIVDKKISTNIKRNMDDFLYEWNLDNGFDKYLASQQENLENKTPIPSNELFVKDLNLTIYNFWVENNKFFDIELDKGNSVIYNNNDKTISFDYKFHITSKKDINFDVNFLDKKINLIPNVKTTIELKVNNKKISNVINYIANRFFCSWSINDLNLKISTPSAYSSIIEKFVPNSKSFSYAFQLEFLNLTANKNYFFTNDSKVFMDKLDINLIKQNIEQEIKLERETYFDHIGNLYEIFNVLSTNPTIGNLFYNIAEPFTKFLVKAEIIDNDTSSVIIDVFKSFKTGKGILSIFRDNKQNIINILVKLLNIDLEGINDIIDLAIGYIGPNMTQKDIDNLKEVLSSLPDDIKNKGIKVIDILIPKPNADPFSLDVIEQLLDLFKDDIKNLLKANLKDPSNIDAIYDSIFKIFSKLIERTKNGDDITYTNKIYDIFIKDKTIKSEIYNDLKIVLKGFGIDTSQMLVPDMKISIDSLINDFYVNNDNLNSTSFSAIFNELKNISSYLKEKANYKIEANFKKLDDKSEIKYNPKENKVEFEYNFKFTFINSLTINLSTLFNIFPNWISMSVNVNGSDNAVGISPKILTRMFPNKIEFSTNDSLNMSFKPIENKIYYSMVKNDNKKYHGFNMMIECNQWFEQENSNKGIISNLLSNFNTKEDFTNPVANGNIKVVFSIPFSTIIGTELNTKENFKVAKEYTQKLLSTKLKWNKFISGFDDSKEISNVEYDNNSYYKGYTFKWNDTDLNQELFKMYNTDAEPSYLSQKYDEYVKMFSYVDSTSKPLSYNYSFVNDKNGSTLNEVMKLKEINDFNQDQKNIFKKDLFTFGNSIKENDAIVSIVPISHMKTNKVISNFNLIKKVHLTLYIELLMFQVNILLPYNVLDLSNINRNDQNYSLTNYSYSNKFTKTFFAPRFSFKSFIQ